MHQISVATSIEVKIRAGIQAQDNRATIDVGRGQFVVPHEDTIDCEVVAKAVLTHLPQFIPALILLVDTGRHWKSHLE